MVAEMVPLTDEETSNATRLALDAEAVKALVPGRTRVVAAHPLRPRRGGPGGGRRAVLGIYDYTNARSAVVLVDLEANSVVGVEETPARFQLHPEEQEEAERLTREDARVQTFLGGREMDPLTRLYFPGVGPSDERRHRFAIVFLRPSTRERKYAVVDLTEGAVVDLLGPDVIKPQ
jgi:hypothetical protein